MCGGVDRHAGEIRAIKLAEGRSREVLDQLALMYLGRPTQSNSCIANRMS